MFSSSFKDGQLKWIIENEFRFSGMPGWKGVLEDDEMWSIVRFLRHLPMQGSQRWLVTQSTSPIGAAIFRSEERQRQSHLVSQDFRLRWRRRRDLSGWPCCRRWPCCRQRPADLLLVLRRPRRRRCADDPGQAVGGCRCLRYGDRIRL
jgi:hypothetical protein